MLIWDEDIIRPFGKFSIEISVGGGEEGTIDIYDGKDKWMATMRFEGEAERLGIIRNLNNAKTVKRLLAYTGVEYDAIIEGFNDAINYAYENGYLDESDESLALLDNDWVNFVGDFIIFVKD